MIKTVFYFRHGETEWNKLGRFQGHSDIPLNSTGIQQALSIAPFIRSCKPQIMMSSDLIRAKQTARIVNSISHLPHLIDPRLREVFLGAAEGKTIDEVNQLWGKSYMERWLDPNPSLHEFRFPEGESKIESIQRIQLFLEKALKELNYQTLAICGHGGTLKRFCQFISNDPYKEVLIPNCCVYRFEFNLESNSWKEFGMVK